MSRVDIGFAETCESWRLISPQFPSKIGGKPAWPNYDTLPSPEELQCAACGNPKTFLCQVYAPYEECDRNFHRSVYVFACKNASCHGRHDSAPFAVFRGNLPRRNRHYSHDPPPEDAPTPFAAAELAQLCALCGCGAAKTCSKCTLPYCSRRHQVLDWKETHKRTCGSGAINGASAHLLPEFELVIEPEELEAKQEVDMALELRACEEMQRASAGELAAVEDGEFERHAAVDGDRTFTRFRKRVDGHPEQVLRYERGGLPLWIAAEPVPAAIPDCEACGSARRFEFQVMPQIIAAIGDNDLDFGVLAVYTCAKSCWESPAYKREFLFKQDVAD